MPLFGMCAISEGPAAAGPSDRNGQSRWLLNGARGRSHYCHAVLAPHFTSHTSQKTRRMRHPRVAQSWFITLRLFFGCQAHKPRSSRTTPRYQSQKARPPLRPSLFEVPTAFCLLPTLPRFERVELVCNPAVLLRISGRYEDPSASGTNVGVTW